MWTAQPQWRFKLVDSCCKKIVKSFVFFLKLFLLEEVRERKFDSHARLIQKAFRQYRMRKFFVDLKQQGKHSYSWHHQYCDVIVTVTPSSSPCYCQYHHYHHHQQDHIHLPQSPLSHWQLPFISASDILYMKKQRRRLTLNRNFVGDYIGFDSNPALRALVG